MKRKNSLLVILLLLGSIARAQDRYPHDNLSNVYSDDNDNIESGNVVQVDPYTGTGNFSFTLYNYKGISNNLSHQVVLGYHGAGNKVDDIASNCGLNWSVNIGGSITRTVMGRPDDLAGGFSNQPVVPTSFGNYDSLYLYGFTKDSLDGQFDIFSYAAGSWSGKFITGKNGQIVQIPENNVKIEILGTKPPPYRDCNSDAFKITIPDGTVYYFNDFNCTLIDFKNSSVDASTEWYLSKIVSSFGTDTIKFNYNYGNLAFNRSLYGMNYRRDPALTDPDDNGQWGLDNFCIVQGPVRYAQLNQVLQNIQYPDGTKVEFGYDPFYRIDLPFGGFALKKVSYVNGDGAEKGFKFNYSYMVRDTASSASAEISYKDYTNVSGYGEHDVIAENYSLQLNNMHPYAGNDSLAGYSFKYNSKKLPPRLYPIAVDLWGYYNGEVRIGPYPGPGFNGIQYLPSTRFPIGKRSGALNHPGGTGLPNLAFARAKSLETIILPTGGTIGIDYELHTSDSWASPNASNYQSFGAISGLRVRQVTYADGLHQNNDKKKTYRYVKDDGISTSGIMLNSPVNNFPYNETFDALDASYKFHLIGECQPSNGIGVYYVNHILARSASPLNWLLYTHGSPVGYQRVEEIDGTEAHYKGKTVYEFTTGDDFSVPTGLVTNSFPFPYIPDYDFAWGLPKKVSTLSARDEVLKETIYSWNFSPSEYNNNNFRSIKVGFKSYPVVNIYNGFDWEYTYPISGRVMLRQKIENGYFNQRDQISTATDYSYEPTHNVLRNTTTKNARSETIQTDYYYPFDFSMTTGPIGKLKSEGVVYSPLRTETWNLNRDQLLGVEVSDFEMVGNMVKAKSNYQFTPNVRVSRNLWGTFNPATLLQGSQYMTKGTTTDIYNSKGNPVQISDNGQLTTIVWGYHNTVPIAKVLNAQAQDVAYTSFENGDEWNGWQSNNSNGSFVTNEGITGEKCYQISGGEDLHKTGLDPIKKYVFTCWTDGNIPGIMVTNPSGSTNITPVVMSENRGWKLYKAEFSNATGIYLGFGFVAHKVDEIRLCPAGAAMNTLTYRPLIGVTSECDPANRVEYKEYDGFGRLIYKKDMDGNIIQAIDYTYQEAQ